MIDASSGQLFAQCLIPKGDYESYVEKVIDSSRYFVLKITNGQRHAFIGLGFEDRNDAFDFNVTLNDFKSTWVDKDVSTPPDLEPTKDLSLKEGQKITVNLKGMEGRKRREENPEGANFTGIALAPPPSSGGLSRRQQSGAQQPPAAAPQSANVGMQPFAPQNPVGAPVPAGGPQEDDFFDDFADFQSASVQTVPAPAPAPAAAQPPRPLVTSSPPFNPTAVPTAAASPTTAGLGMQFEQPNLGGAAATAPASQPLQQRQPSNTAQDLDPFSSLSTVQPTTFTQPQPVFSPPRAKQGGNDPFDEFDIFK